MTVGPALSFAERLHTASMRADAPPDPACGAGVEDALREIPGIMAAMLVAFGANGICTVEDLAACATDDLVGWTERSGAQITRHPAFSMTSFCRGRNATRSSYGLASAPAGSRPSR